MCLEPLNIVPLYNFQYLKSRPIFFNPFYNFNIFFDIIHFEKVFLITFFCAFVQNTNQL